ncbi:MAG: SDR family NAD(P)-dependent oxidoreductase [Congregibacter sp.]
MQHFEKTVGFITGGASGIGLGMARGLGQRGMTVVLADIEASRLDSAASTLRAEGIAVETAVLDVRDAQAYKAIARQTLDRHGAVHFLFNNAGVAGPSPVGESTIEDWRWVVDVNLMGVVHGVEFFLPAMRAAGEPGYIINTASMAGHLASPGMASYCATKYAVVGYSEVMDIELRETPIDVSVLCPAFVKTRIADSMRNHPNPDVAAVPNAGAEKIGRIIDHEGMSVEDLVERILKGMAARTFYLFSHKEFWPHMQKRMDLIRADYQEVL